MGGLIIKAITGLAAVAIVGTASAIDPRGSLDAFIQKQRAVSLQGALNNIGPNGSQVPGAGAGYIVASPSTTNPDYFYTWTRDGALTMKMIVDEFILGKTDLQAYVEDYVHSQAVLQTVTNPSGTFLPSGAGLGEPKYKVDGTRYNGAWGRPQRDGPALRAIALITYSNWLIAHGQKARAKNVIWPIISNDLSYVGQYWNSTGFDLWEEVNGSSFFTTQNQYRALIEGTRLASALGVNCTGCGEASDISCFLQQAYWNSEYFVANINVDNGRTGKDANTILGSIALFDVNAKCDDPSIQPCNSRGLSNFKALVDSFRNATLYPINKGIAKDKGIAVGRYTEDVYFGGNPWYLITAGAAEYLYDAVAQWKAQGSLIIDKTSLSFFKDIYPNARTKTYKRTAAEFSRILGAVTAYADSFAAVVQQYTPQNGSLSEQFDRAAPGAPLSARDLTWSYAAFVTMAERRAGQFPPSWVVPSPPPSSNAPATAAACGPAAPSPPKGVYVPALAAGAPNVTATCTSTVLFQVNASTYYGENVFVAGSSADLGTWDLDNAWPLDATGYTAERPLWSARVAMTAGETVTYAYARQEDCGQDPIWETVNRTLVVPACDEDADSEEVRLETDDQWTGSVGSSGGCPGSGTG
ncbi:carbohydrate-binding module family 20 protein [Biscogniauxia sp. FL1348]|nr:carbohydrate-binding module family 20 protein [Biscogniauxia sp. FL1348]